MKNKYDKIINQTILDEQNRRVSNNEIVNNIAVLQIDANTNQIIWFSNDIYTILGINQEEKNITLDFIFKHTTDADKKEIENKFELLIEKGIKIDHLFKIKRKSDKKIRHIYLNAEIKNDLFNKPMNIIVVLTDITDHKKITDQGKIAEYMYRTLYNKSPYGIAVTDSFSGIIYKANKKYRELVPIKFKENSTIDWMSITHPDDIQEDLDNMKKMNKGENDGFTMEKRYIRPDGSYIWIRMTIIPIIIEDKKLDRHLCMIEDITEKKEHLIKIKYTLEHDLLTGLYNRDYINTEFNRMKAKDIFPTSIILGNINGMKMYNDTFGHNLGDKEIKKIGKRIKEFCRPDMVVARVNGAEFAIMIIEYEEMKVNEFVNALYDYVNQTDQNTTDTSLTISFGYSIQGSKNDDLNMLYREAELHVYNKKYINTKSSRSKAINLIMEALFIKSPREKNHSQRVGELAYKIAQTMKITTQSINRTRIAGFLHDIGKIGIDDNILNKKGILEKKEWEIIRLHPIKGAEILEKSIEYRQLTDIVISHHERYDGNGYPNGLSGKEIPIEARIICLADAYDAMTQERSYKEVMTHEEALEEIKRCSGSHFDPDIVDVFINNFTR